MADGYTEQTHAILCFHVGWTCCFPGKWQTWGCCSFKVLINCDLYEAFFPTVWPTANALEKWIWLPLDTLTKDRNARMHSFLSSGHSHSLSSHLGSQKCANMEKLEKDRNTSRVSSILLRTEVLHNRNKCSWSKEGTNILQSRPLSLMLLITLLPPEADETHVDQYWPNQHLLSTGLLQDCPLKKASRVLWRVVIFNCKLPRVLLL